MRPGSALAAGLLVLGLASTPSFAQDAAPESYKPLFTEAMIRSAAPAQRERMRAAEAANRQSYERRAEERAQAARPVPPASGAAPAPAPRPTHSKIYKWVDAQGRTHFGDAPAGTGAEEITIKGSLTPPTPAPTPRATPGDAPADLPSSGDGRNDSRSRQRGS